MFCGKCGKKIIDGDEVKFCNHCGYKQSEQVVTTRKSSSKKRIPIICAIIIVVVGFTVLGAYLFLRDSGDEPTRIMTENAEIYSHNENVRQGNDDESCNILIRDEASTIIMFSPNHSHATILKEDGTVWTWGWENRFGQLGDGTTDRREIPTQIQNLADITAISTSNLHTVALRNDGTVWAWGSNAAFNALGDGTTTEIYAPIQIRELTNVTAISTDHFQTAVLKNDGTVWAWGNKVVGPHGYTTSYENYDLMQISGLTDIIEICVGSFHIVALRSDGTVWAWGDNTSGVLGDGTTIGYQAPVQVQGLTNITAISAASSHTVALRNDGTVWAWGRNDHGLFGDDITNSHHIPVQIQGLADVTAISTTFQHSVALKSDGTVWTWGDNTMGQLGDGTEDNRHSPVQARGLTDIVKVSAGSSSTMALGRDGTLWAWGRLPAGGCSHTPIPVQGLSNHHDEARIADVSALVGRWESLTTEEDTILVLNVDGTGSVGFEHDWYGYTFELGIANWSVDNNILTATLYHRWPDGVPAFVSEYDLDMQLVDVVRITIQGNIMTMDEVDEYSSELLWLAPWTRVD